MPKAFVFRPWTDLNTDPRYKDIVNREDKMKAYFADNKEAIVALDWEGPIPFEYIFSEGPEKISIDSYVTDDQGHTFFSTEVQRDIKDWRDVWIYKMSLSSRGSFNTYYFNEIMKEDTHRAKIMRIVLGMKLGGKRGISNT